MNKDDHEIGSYEDMYWAGFVTMLVIVILVIMMIASGGASNPNINNLIMGII